MLKNKKRKNYKIEEIEQFKEYLLFPYKTSLDTGDRQKSCIACLTNCMNEIEKAFKLLENGEFER